MDDAVRLGALLQARGWRLAVAESCTGGLLGHTITEVPGSSAYFLGGALVYADALKQALLGVRAESLQRWGAVSARVALEMAAGVQQLTGAEIGVGVTGIAGPGGGTALKPVGLTYIALAAPGERRVWRRVWPGDRSANKQASVWAALGYVCAYLSGAPVALSSVERAAARWAAAARRCSRFHAVSCSNPCRSVLWMAELRAA